VDNDAQAVTIQVPVTVSGTPPVIAFEPGYLASALEIGPVLRLLDGMSPGVTVGPGGVFCLVMPMRCTVAAAPAHSGDQEPAQEIPDVVAVAA
jgi:hypothetical protein